MKATCVWKGDVLETSLLKERSTKKKQTGLLIKKDRKKRARRFFEKGLLKKMKKPRWNFKKKDYEKEVLANLKNLKIGPNDS